MADTENDRQNTGPDEGDVKALTELLDLLYPDAGWHQGEESTAPMSKNESAARYLLTSNWFVREGVDVATRAAASDAAFWASREARASTTSTPQRLHLITERPDANTPGDQLLALYKTACGQRLGWLPEVSISHWGFGPEDLRKLTEEYADNPDRNTCDTCLQALEAIEATR